MTENMDSQPFAVSVYKCIVYILINSLQLKIWLTRRFIVSTLQPKKALSIHPRFSVVIPSILFINSAISKYNQISNEQLVADVQKPAFNKEMLVLPLLGLMCLCLLLHWKR